MIAFYTVVATRKPQGGTLVSNEKLLYETLIKKQLANIKKYILKNKNYGAYSIPGFLFVNVYV